MNIEELMKEFNVIENAFDIPGLYYIKDYLNEQEEKLLLNKISTLKFLPLSDSINSRRVAHFGYHYAYNRSGLTKTDPIPNDLILGEFDQLIINEYKPNQQISAHIDHVQQFGPIIACITVGQSIPITFSNDIKKVVNIENRSMYVMTEDARYKWKHALKNNTNHTRYSLTYRTVNKI